MKLAAKILGGILLLVILGIAGLLTYLATAFPKVDPAPDLAIEVTPERVERGAFLANHVFVCMDCHSDRDYSRFAHSIDSTSPGKGGNLFGKEEGLPGDFYAKNLTPYNLGKWTDGEIFRAVTSGVTKEGKAMFPIMPYTNYAKADKEDIYSIIAYLRTLKPIEHDVPESASAFPMSFIINTIPRNAENPEAKPDISDRVTYGKYLVTVASCGDCHTPMEQGAPIQGMEFSGGMTFPIPTGGIATSANITPHEITGIGALTEEDFINRFKRFEDPLLAINTDLVPPGEMNTSMPWRLYSKMSEEDLGAIYAYLRTVPPVDNAIVRFTPDE